MTEKTKNDFISRIIKLQMEEVRLIINGYKPYIGDQFQSRRDEINMLRCIVYGYESSFCKIKKESHGTPFS